MYNICIYLFFICVYVHIYVYMYICIYVHKLPHYPSPYPLLGKTCNSKFNSQNNYDGFCLIGTICMNPY